MEGLNKCKLEESRACFCLDPGKGQWKQERPVSVGRLQPESRLLGVKDLGSEAS